MAWYGFFQLLVVIALLSYAQWSTLSYGWGVVVWAALLGTTMTTAFWLEERSPDAVLKWERLRLLCLGVVMLWAAAAGAPVWLLLVWAGYIVANVWFLVRLAPGLQTAPTITGQAPG